MKILCVSCMRLSVRAMTESSLANFLQCTKFQIQCVLLHFKLDCAAEFFDLAKTLINEEDEALCRRSYGLFKLVIDVGGHSSLWAVPPLYKCPELCKNQVDQAMGSKSVSSVSLCWFSPPGSCLDFLP